MHINTSFLASTFSITGAWNLHRPILHKLFLIRAPKGNNGQGKLHTAHQRLTHFVPRLKSLEYGLVLSNRLSLDSWHS